jgi:hypothetical protein
MLAFISHQIFGSIARNINDVLLSKKVWVTKGIVFAIILTVLLYALISSSEKSKKDWLKIAIVLLLLVWAIWAIVLRVRE